MNQKGFLSPIIFLVVVISLGLIAAIFYFGGFGTLKGYVFQNKEKINTASDSNSKRAEKIDTSEWKNFVEDSSGLTFKYPKEWSGSTGTIMAEPLPDDCKNKDQYQCSLSLKSIGSYLRENKNRLSPLDFVADYYQSLVRAREYIKPSDDLGIPFEVLIKRKIKKDEDGFVSSGQHAYLFKDDNVVDFFCANCSDELFNAILSSVKFLDKTIADPFPEPKKRLFDVNAKIYDTQSIPEELIKYNEDELVPLSCSPAFSKNLDGDPYTIYDTNLKINRTLTSPEVLGMISKIIDRRQAERLSLFAFCKTDDGRTIVSYEKVQGGGGSGNIMFYGWFDKSGSFHDIVSIPNYGVPYFGCSTAIQLTKSNLLYVMCGGSDLGGSQSIHKIDLNSKTASQLLRCDINMNEVVSCK